MLVLPCLIHDLMKIKINLKVNFLQFSQINVKQSKRDPIKVKKGLEFKKKL